MFTINLWGRDHYYYIIIIIIMYAYFLSSL